MKKLIAISFLVSPLAAADFVAVGPIQGNVCTGFVIEACSLQEVHAIKEDGKLFSIGRRYPEVSNYDAGKGRCWIQTKSVGAGFGSAGVNAAMQPDFYGRDSSGALTPLDVEYLTFKCRKI